MRSTRFSWHSLSIRLRLSLMIQLGLIVILGFTQRGLMASFETKVLEAAKIRAEETADGIINGMNMLMLTGQISKPEVRKLFIEKMGKSQGIRELRIIRSERVNQQFGPGLPEERIRDDVDRKVLNNGLPYFEHRNAETQSLRAVIPFIASHNFRGTDCLACHRVPVGAVNGAASIVLDLTDEFTLIKTINLWLWIGQVLLQILLFFVIDLLIRSVTDPIGKMQKVMSAIQQDGDLSRRVDINTGDEIGKMAQVFNALTASLQHSMTQEKLAKDQLRLAAQVFFNSAEAIVITDRDNNILQINRAFSEITGYTSAEVVGKNPRILKSGQQGQEFYREMWTTLLATGAWQGEVMDRRKSGDIYPKWLSIAVVKNEANEITNFIALFTDITERRASLERIQHLAHYDALTSLPNRMLLEDHINQAIETAKRNQGKFALLFLDLDRFKQVNDTLGHHAGDLLLQEVSQRLKLCVRSVDTIARLGGDEFVIVLSSINQTSDAATVAAKIIEAIGKPYLIERNDVNIGVSIGIGIYPDHATELALLTKHADEAMYHAKQLGRNNYQFYRAD